MAAFKYTGHYDRFIDGVGAVKTGDVIEFPEQPPGYDWIPLPESAPEPVPAPFPRPDTPPVTAVVN